MLSRTTGGFAPWGSDLGRSGIWNVTPGFYMFLIATVSATSYNKGGIKGVELRELRGHELVRT